jgi:hypothetical protein
VRGLRIERLRAREEIDNGQQPRRGGERVDRGRETAVDGCVGEQQTRMPSEAGERREAIVAVVGASSNVQADRAQYSSYTTTRAVCFSFS